MNQLMDAKAASLSAFGGRNSEGLSMSCLKPFANDMLDLFFKTMTEPHFEKAAVTREINDGLLSPRFAPSQRAWVLSGEINRVSPSVPASVPQDGDNR